MAMTYYAVTDDPNELAHWGVKGMKWGVRHDKPRHSGSSKPRSVAYKKAQGKLSMLMRHGIKRVQAHWKAYHSPEAKYERQTNKALEKARKGKLKYGKLTDDQVRRITERLAMERNARMLSETEKTFMHRLGQSIGQGVISGVGAGTSSYINKRFEGRGATTAKIKGEKRMAKYEASRAGRRAAKRRAKAEINEEYYKTAYEEGIFPSLRPGARRRGRHLAEARARERENEFDADIQRTYERHAARLRAQADQNTPATIYNPSTNTLTTTTQYDINTHNYRARRRQNSRSGRSGRS